jgi:AbiTii
MPRSDAKLLDEIEHVAVDANGDVAVALRKCLILGGKLRSPELRAWATSELSGYADANSVPAYRIVPARLVIDGSDAVKIVNGQEISPMQLPDFARDSLDEHLEMSQPIGKIEDIIRTKRDQDGTIAFSVPGSSDLVAYMNHQSHAGGGYSVIHRIYKVTDVSELVGIVEHVRLRLTELMAELRAGIHDGELTEGTARQAVSVAIGGDRNRVTVNAPSAGNDLVVLRESEGWGWKAWSIVGGVATIAGFVLALVVL